MSERRKVVFRTNHTVSHLPLNQWKSEPLIIEITRPWKITVSLKPPNEEEMSQGYRRDTALGEATSCFEVTERIYRHFSNLANRLPPRGLRREDLDERFDEEGRLTGRNAPGLEHYSKEFQVLVNKATKTLGDVFMRTVRVLRWAEDTTMPHTPFASRFADFSIDGISWWPLPHGDFIVHISDSRVGFNKNTIRKDEIVRMVNDELDEPIGHLLFREADLQRWQNPRSSLVIAVAALEAGIKDLIVQLEPSTSWLVENLQSPSVIKLLAKYLPLLPVKNMFDDSVKYPSASALKLIEKAVNSRNQTIHLGKKAPTRAEIDEMLRTIKNTLYLFDYYAGHKWALKCLDKGYVEGLRGAP